MPTSSTTVVDVVVMVADVAVSVDDGLLLVNGVLVSDVPVFDGVRRRCSADAAAPTEAAADGDGSAAVLAFGAAVRRVGATMADSGSEIGAAAADADATVGEMVATGAGGAPFGDAVWDVDDEEEAVGELKEGDEAAEDADSGLWPPMCSADAAAATVGAVVLRRAAIGVGLMAAPGLRWLPNRAA